MASEHVTHDKIKDMFDNIYGTNEQLVKPIEIEIVFWNPLNDETSWLGHISVNITTQEDKISYSLGTKGCDINEFNDNDKKIKIPLNPQSYWDVNQHRNGYGFILDTTMLQAIIIKKYFESNFMQGKKDGVCDYKIAVIDFAKNGLNKLVLTELPSFNACLTPIQKALYFAKMIDFSDMCYLPSSFIDMIHKKNLVKYKRIYLHSAPEAKPLVTIFKADNFPWSKAIKDVHDYYANAFVNQK